MAISEKRISICLATVQAIAQCSSVDQYLIGYTRETAGKKGDAYRRLGFEHFVLLADKLTRADGLKPEGALQRATMGDRSSPIHEKYHAEKRANGRFFNSSGGSPADPLAKETSVYMVWWTQ